MIAKLTARSAQRVATVLLLEKHGVHSKSDCSSGSGCWARFSRHSATISLSVLHELCVSMLSVQTLLSWMQFASRSSTLVQSEQLEPIWCLVFLTYLHWSEMIINDHLWNLAELCQMTQESVADYTETNRNEGWVMDGTVLYVNDTSHEKQRFCVLYTATEPLLTLWTWSQPWPFEFVAQWDHTHVSAGSIIVASFNLAKGPIREVELLCFVVNGQSIGR